MVGASDFQNTVRIGTNDVTAGILEIYGHAAGTSEGAEIHLYTAADHDATSEFWTFDVFQDDIRFFPAGASGNRVEIKHEGQMHLLRTGSAGGLVIGGDANLYRDTANVLRTDDNFSAPNIINLSVLSSGTGTGAGFTRIDLDFAAGITYNTEGGVAHQFNIDDSTRFTINTFGPIMSPDATQTNTLDMGGNGTPNGGASFIINWNGMTGGTLSSGNVQNTNNYIANQSATSSLFYNVPTGLLHIFTIAGANKLRVKDAGIDIRGVTYSWPSTQGSSSSFLKNDGSGNLTWGNFTTASQDLDMAEFDIINADAIYDGATKGASDKQINMGGSQLVLNVGSGQTLSFRANASEKMDITETLTRSKITGATHQWRINRNSTDPLFNIKRDQTYNVGGSEGSKISPFVASWLTESPPVELPRGRTSGNKTPITYYLKEFTDATEPEWGSVWVMEATNVVDSAYTTPSNHKTTFIADGWIAMGHSLRTPGRAEIYLNSFDVAGGPETAVLHFGRGKTTFENDEGTSSTGTTHWSMDSRYSSHDGGGHDDQSRLQIWEWPGNPDGDNNGNAVFIPRLQLMPNVGWLGLSQAGLDFQGGFPGGGVSRPVAAFHVKTDVGSDKGGNSGFPEVVAVFENDNGNGTLSSYTFNQTDWPGACNNSTGAQHTAISIVARLDRDPIIYLSERTAFSTSKIDSSAWAATPHWDIRNDSSAGDEFQIHSIISGTLKTEFTATKAHAVYTSAPNGQPSTISMAGPWISFYINETNNTAHFLVKETAGTTFTGQLGGSGGGGGWTDDGTVVRLDTASDDVSIGSATPVTGAKLSVIETADSSKLAVKATATGGTADEAQLEFHSGTNFTRFFYRDSDDEFGIFHGEGGTNVTRFRINGNGELHLAILNSTPTDADLANNTAVFYTSGTTDFRVKVKDSGGTVRTASLGTLA